MRSLISSGLSVLFGARAGLNALVSGVSRIVPLLGVSDGADQGYR